MQEVQIGRRPLLLTAHARPDPRHNVPPHPAMDVRVARPIAPAQIRIQHVPRKVVREQPVDARLHERQPAQPLEQRASILAIQRRAQQILARHARVRAHLQRPPVTLARNAGHEPLQQHPQHVRRLAELEPQHRRYIAALVEHVDEQRQRQRMPMRELEHALVQPSSTPATRKNARVSSGERLRSATTRNSSRHPASSSHPRLGASRPATTTRLSAAQTGQKALAHPPVQARGRLIGIKQQHPPPARPQHRHGRRAIGHPHRAGDRRQEARRRHLDTAQIDPPYGHPGRLRASANAASSAVLPTPPGPYTNSTPHGAAGSLHRRPEQLQLARPTDKPTPPRAPQPRPERRRRPHLLRLPRIHEPTSPRV